MSLRVGHIAYANCVPFFHYLREAGFDGSIHPGVPSELNALLAAGRIDLSPSSSFEYGRNPHLYGLLPDLSISSCGPVQSVLLFAPCPLEKLAGVPVSLTGESATSINLLRLLCLEFYGFQVCGMPGDGGSVEDMVNSGGAGLLIGDRALKAAQKLSAPYVYDLGELWWRHTGLPFVFALWMVHRSAISHNGKELARFYHHLKTSLQRALSDIDHLALENGASRWMAPGKLADYWRAMSYTFTGEHRRGLELYYRLAVKHRLLEEIPPLNFIETAF